MRYRVVQPWDRKDKGRQSSVLSEHPTIGEAFAVIDRLAAQANRTDGRIEDLDLQVTDADGRIISRRELR